jgi:ATP-dependent DNA helicase RecQ
MQVLQRHFGFSAFRPAQRAVVAAVLAGRDVLAVLPTGGGKSACFQVPALVRPGLTLVVSPLIALMQDQVEAAVRRRIPAAFVSSALDPPAQSRVLDAVGAGRCRLLYVAPERLPRLSAELEALSVCPGLLAVDEAHCISEWGHDFRPAFRRIAEARRAMGWPQILALTGSATADVREDIRHSLSPQDGGRGFLTHVASFDRANLWFGAERVADERQRLERMVRLVRGEAGATIVYVGTRNVAESLARVLASGGVRAVPYHAGLTRLRRAETLRRFLRGDARVVVATCAFGMGIDKPDVRLVAHWTMPATPESYYQEAGRAGRDGRPARCVLLWSATDVAYHRRLLDVTFPRPRTIEKAWADPAVMARLPDAVQASVLRLRAELRPERGRAEWRPILRRRRLAEGRIEAMARYSSRRGCRRRELLDWFGEPVRSCTGCDRCGGFLTAGPGSGCSA